MLYSLRGKIVLRIGHMVVIETQGVGYRVYINTRTARSLPKNHEDCLLYVHLHMREGGAELYGVTDEEELSFFELLLTVSGVGPKSALSILDLTELQKLSAAIQEGRADLLTHAIGIGKKTAERIVLELRDKVGVKGPQGLIERIEGDRDLAETLVTLGYRRREVEEVLARVRDSGRIEDRLKEALKLLNKK